VSFVQDYLEYTKDYESPTSFWKWSAYSSISAVLRDNVFRRLKGIPLYPNIYVLLLAPSAGRKGNPINTAQRLITGANNTKIISGRSSIQAIIDELAHVETNAKTGKLIKGGSAIFIASELAAGLVSDDAAVGILTDIYDTKVDFKHHLRSTGRLKIDRIVFSMFSGSNEALLKALFTTAAINGGLLGRTFLVVPDTYRPPNSLLGEHNPEEDERLFEKIQAQLKQMTELSGEIHIASDAIQEFDNWYKPFYNSLKQKKDQTGVNGRLHINVLKLAMILTANDQDMSMRRCHVEQAIDECVALAPNYEAFTMGSGKSTISEAGGIFFTELLKADKYTISRKKFLQAHWVNVDSEILDKLIVTLETSGYVTQLVSGNEITYSLTKLAVETMGGGDKEKGKVQNAK
jgi:hypothetical protein